MSKPVKKVIRKGQVAVLVSPGYGGGWSTWVDDSVAEELLFDPDIVRAVLDGKKDTVPDLVEAKYPGRYVFTGGTHQLEVEWVTKGSRFMVEEYDGSESIRVFGPETGWLA